MKYLSYYIILSLALLSCQKKEIFSPINSISDNYIKNSQEYSKVREGKEREYLQKWVNKQKDSLNNNFESTNGGIWMRYIKKNNQILPKNNDLITYTAEIKTLSNKVIYSQKEFGTKEIILGKFKEIRGIETALYKMGKGDISELVLPSFTAYGLYGDDNKIGANVPLLIELYMLDVKSKN